MSDFDIIVVGSGCAGGVAAYVAAAAGKSGLVVERGNFAGAKNMTGGRSYSHSLKQVFPDFESEAPVERKITHERIAMMDPSSQMTVDFTSSELGEEGKDSYSVLRGPFDQWLAEKAEEAGAEYICGIAVEELIKDGSGRVTGVRAGDDEITAEVVILAEGTNSMLSERCLGNARPKANQMAVGIKEVFELPSDVIEDRFLLPEGEGAAMLFVGDCTKGSVGGGFLYKWLLHLLDSEYTVYNISSKTKDVFAIKMDGEDGLVELYRVSNLETGELEKLGGKISEAMLYGDGSVSFVGDCDLASNKYNPIGSLYLYDPATGAVEKMADNVAAVLESTVRSSGWLNENAKELATGEMMGSSEEEDTLYAGQLHYIDGQGNLCVVAKGSATVGDSGLQGFTIFENFYSVNGYAINYDIDFASATDKALYWSLGDQLYRYQLGSMQSPQVLPLDESLEDKAGNDAQVGYFVTGSGDVVEETEQKLVLKNFDDESSITILENVGQLNLIGMDNDGENIYFISEDNSLYAKSLTSRSNPKRIASDVTQAVATSHGLYFLQKSQQPVVGQSGEEQEEQTDLMFLQYGQKKASCLLEDVNSISTIYLAE